MTSLGSFTTRLRDNRIQNPTERIHLIEIYECETATSREKRILQVKIQFNSIVIQLKPAVARLHKKEMQLCKLYLGLHLSQTVMIKQRNLTSLSFVFEMLHFRVRVA